jgi:DNA-binding response OmpR family regulator
VAHILVVDDDADLLDVIALVLQRSGHRVERAATGPEAVSRALASPPQLVLLDVMLPLMGGREVLQALRADPSGSTIPVVLMSAAHDAMYAIAREQAVAQCLPKPFPMASLLAAVAEAARPPADGAERDPV